MADTDNTNTGGATDKAEATITVPKAKTAEDIRHQIEASKQLQADDREQAAKPANIGAAAVGRMEASGSFIEDGAKKVVDVDHPAVDNNPRAGTTVRQNQVDFNDPYKPDHQAVSEALAG